MANNVAVRNKGHRSLTSRRNRNSNPVSKSDMIRKLASKGKDTGQIREALMNAGFKHVHYSEIYGAQERAQS